MHAGNHRYGRPAIDPDGERRCISHGEISVAAHNRGDRGSARSDPTHIADVGEALGLQQLLGDVLGRIADAGDLHKAHFGGFEWPLCGECHRRADEARGAGQ